MISTDNDSLQPNEIILIHIKKDKEIKYNFFLGMLYSILFQKIKELIEGKLQNTLLISNQRCFLMINDKIIFNKHFIQQVN